MTWRERIRRPFRSWTLRQKLVITVVSVVALLGLLIGTASVLALQSYLLGRLDQTVQAAALRGQTVAIRSMQFGQQPSADGIVNGPGQAVGTFVAVIANGVVGEPEYLGTQAVRQTVSTNIDAILLALPVNGEAHSVDLGGTLRDYRLVAVAMPDNGALIVGLPLSDVHRTTEQLTFIVLFATVAAGLIAAGIGLLVVRIALRPLERVAGAATAVTELPLDRGEVALAVRVPEEDTDPRTEVGRVGSAFNAMLGHVAGALEARQQSENKVRQFVSDASHELRTPLASIRGYSELTRRSPDALSPDMQRSLGRIESEALRMTAIVEDLLLLARLDEGRELDREPVDLTMLSINLLSDAHAAGPDHVWLLELPEEPVEVVGDELRLHQVVANLLTNARVHTPAGTTVTLALNVEGDAIGDETAVLTVTDDGQGIPREQQATLFERFARGDSSRSRETGSTGLGLAIAKAVVEAHDGQIGVASEPGRTVFTVRLPLGARGSDVSVPAPLELTAGESADQSATDRNDTTRNDTTIDA